MAEIRPFRGLRYNKEKIKDMASVTTQPYDIISPEKQLEYYDHNEYNVIRLEYGVINDTDDVNNNRYTRAKEALEKFISDKALVYEDKPAIYIYQQDFELPNGEVKSCKGIISLVKLEEFSKKVVLPHEETLSKAKADRFNLMCTTDCNFSQVYCLYLDAKKEIVRKIKELSLREPDVSFTSEDEIQQKLWVITDESVIAEFVNNFKDKQLFIADGHHRYETAINYRNKLREENPSYDENELFNYVMMMLVEMEDEGLVVFPTHRVVRNLENFDELDIVSKMQEHFEMSKITLSDEGELARSIEKHLASEPGKKTFCFYTGENYFYMLKYKDDKIMDSLLPDNSDAYRNLDVNILHTLILNKMFGIDMENMANQKNLTYTRDINEALDDVKKGMANCSFMLNATKVSEIKEVSLANEKMPQKSTYFYPKIITGMVINKFR